jgi:hypothetical protein
LQKANEVNEDNKNIGSIKVLADLKNQKGGASEDDLHEEYDV